MVNKQENSPVSLKNKDIHENINLNSNDIDIKQDNTRPFNAFIKDRSCSSM